MQRPILVTGAAGFAGSHLVDQLQADAPGPIVGWDRAAGRRTDRRPPCGDVRWLQIDLLDREAVASAVAALRPAIVFHCAGAPHVGSAWRETLPALRANVLGTHHLLEAVRRARLDARVVVIGSALVYQASPNPLTEDDPLRPSSPYAVSKLGQELVAREAAREGLDVVIVRPFNHIGPRQQPSFATASFARQIALAEVGRAAPVLRVGNLAARRDVTDVRDTVRAYRLLARSGQAGRPYNVCSGRAPSVDELLRKLLEQARVAVDVQVDPDLLRPSDTPVLLGDPRRVREEVGWRPEIPLDQTLADLLEYWRAAVANQ